MIQPGRTVYDEHLFVWPLARISRKLLHQSTGRAWSLTSPGPLGPLTGLPLKADHPIGLTAVSALPRGKRRGQRFHQLRCTHRVLLVDVRREGAPTRQHPLNGAPDDQVEMVLMRVNDGWRMRRDDARE